MDMVLQARARSTSRAKADDSTSTGMGILNESLVKPLVRSREFLPKNIPSVTVESFSQITRYEFDDALVN